MRRGLITHKENNVPADISDAKIRKYVNQRMGITYLLGTYVDEPLPFHPD